MQDRVNEPSKGNRITNVVATALAIAGAVIASPTAIQSLPVDVVTTLRYIVTVGNTIQPLVATLGGIVVAAITHPPKWLHLPAHGS